MEEKMVVLVVETEESKQSKAFVSKCTTEVVASIEQLTGMLKPAVIASSRAVLVLACIQLHSEQAFNHHSTQKSAYNIAPYFD
ncbi:hypothetical protein ACOSQ3_003332 [Xanthoceras sorbifolium]